MLLPRLILSSALLVTMSLQAPAATDDPGQQVAAVTSAELERSLQQLSWPDFRAVISAIPKLKADVDAYGTFGWQYVEANYRSYRWAKKIDKLDADQKHHLAELISETRGKSRPQSQ